MSDIKQQANSASETSRQYDKIRKDRLKDAYKQSRKKDFGEEPEQSVNEQEQDTQNPEQNTENSEEKLDNDQNNSYINEEQEDKTSEVESEEKESKDSEESEELSKAEKVFKEQFKEDPIKAVEAWSNANSEFMKLRNKYKETQQKLSHLDELAQKNPNIEKEIKRATNSDFQSLDEGSDKESVEDKPVSTSQKSKLNSKELFNVNEDDLAEAGYIDPSEKDIMESSQWNNKIRQAKLRYMEDNLPDMIADKAAQKTQERIDEYEREKRRKAQEQKNRKLIEERYTDGIEKVVEDYGLDFAGNKEHEAMLDEIENLVVNIRDPQNPDVIHPNAVKIATQQVMSSRGMQVPNQNAEAQKQREEVENKANNMFNKNKFNANKRTENNTQSKPQNIAEKLASKHRKNYEETMKKRKQTGRIRKND